MSQLLLLLLVLVGPPAWEPPTAIAPVSAKPRAGVKATYRWLRDAETPGQFNLWLGVGDDRVQVGAYVKATRRYLNYDPATLTWHNGPAPVTVPTTLDKAGAVHRHACPQCRTTWTHTDASFGKEKPHRCPACNFGPVYDKDYRRSTTLTAPGRSVQICPT